MKFYFSILFSVLSSLALSQQQDPWECGGIVEDPPIQNNLPSCPAASQTYLSHYKKMDHYKIDNKTATKTINVAFHIWLGANGEGNWIEDQATLDLLQGNIIGWMNGKYQYPKPSTEDFSPIEFLDDSEFRVNLAGVYFYYENSMYQISNKSTLTDFIEVNYPERLNALPIHFGDVSISEAGNSNGTQFFNDDHIPSILTRMNPMQHGEYSIAAHLAHELGHNLDLKHTYDGNCSGIFPDVFNGQGDSCCPETMIQSDNGYVADIFDYSDNWCNSPNGACYECNPSGCDPLDNVNSHCSNNFMGGLQTTVEIGHYFSPLQLGKMHRATHITSVRQFTWGYNETPWEITGIETWDFPIKIYNNIVVKSGAVLTVKCKIQFVPEAKLIVEPGGRLVIDGGELTTAKHSISKWQGVEIWGNSNQIQQSQFQGTVEILNDGTISNAINGVRVWKPGDWSSTGGIIRANDGNFINNSRDVEFIAYQSNGTGVYASNLSYFNECDFITNSSYIGTTKAPHVSMYRVDGISFTACNFSDFRDVTLQYKNKGIHSLDSKFKVLGKYIGSTPQQVDEFDTQYYLPSTFNNLTHGVWAGNVNTVNTVMVDQSLFTDCAYGVELSQSDNAVISRNKFDRTNNSSWVSYQLDIYSNKSTGYFIEGNTLTKQQDADWVWGIANEDSAYDNNEVRNNTISSIEQGIFSVGRNWNGETNNQATGLEHLCNDLVENTVDDIMYVENVTGDGLKFVQGNEPQPAGNKFSPAQTGFTNINSNLNSNTRYYYYDNSPNDVENPTTITSNVIEIDRDVQNLCKSSFDVVYPRFGSILNVSASSLVTQHEGLQSDLGDELFELSKATDSTVIDSLEQKIIWIRREMSRTQNLLLKDALLDSTTIDSAQFVTWSFEKNSPYMYYQLADFAFSHNDATKLTEYLNSISSLADGLPRGDLKTEYEDYESFKQNMYTRSQNSVLEGLDANTEAYVRDVAQNGTGHAKIQAQNLLCFFIGECNEPSLPTSSGARTGGVNQSSELIQGVESSLLSLYPNPSDSEITISLTNELKIVEIQIFDSEGKVNFSKKLDNKMDIVNISELNAGIYYVLVKDENQVTHLKKLIKK